MSAHVVYTIGVGDNWHDAPRYVGVTMDRFTRRASDHRKRGNLAPDETLRPFASFRSRRVAELVERKLIAYCRRRGLASGNVSKGTRASMGPCEHCGMYCERTGGCDA